MNKQKKNIVFKRNHLLRLNCIFIIKEKMKLSFSTVLQQIAIDFNYYFNLIKENLLFTLFIALHN